MSQEKYKPPEPDSKDTAHLVARGILSLIPATAELFEYFVQPPLEQRRDKWMHDVAEGLRRLEDSEGINLEELRTNDEFISIMTQASVVAILDHRQEKISALKNAIFNSARKINIAEDLKLIFIRFIDELSPSHLLVLGYLSDHIEEIRGTKSYDALYKDFLSAQSVPMEKDEFRLLVSELVTRNLVRISQDITDFDDIYQGSFMLLSQTDDSLPTVVLTNVGNAFIRYIGAVVSDDA